MKLRPLTSALALAAMLALPVGASSAVAGTDAASAVDPAAIDAAKRMGAYLRTLNDFQVVSQAQLEEVLDNGKKVFTSVSTTAKVHRPDGFTIDMTTDHKARRFYYDGKSFTVFAPKVGYYASVSAPATIDDTVQVINDNYGIVLPLADVFYWGTDQEPFDNMDKAVHVGAETVDGVATDHYAYAGGGIAWDVWIEQGATPLPVKMVITTMGDSDRPTYSSDLSWSTQVAFAPGTFTFSPSADAKPIAMASVEQ